MEILGQEHVLRYLVEGSRQSRLSPSLLFVGPDGVGKRAMALELAKTYMCEQPPAVGTGLPSCGACGACRRVGAFNHPDVFYADRAVQAVLLKEKPESQTALKIETVRQAERFLHLRPSEGRRRVAILDVAHRLTNEAANALLKVLEEPPANAQFVMIGADEHALPPTVLSRCAVLRFRPVATGLIARWLTANHGMEAERAAEIADRSGGSFQRALSLRDEDAPALDLSDFAVDTFFDALGEINWRKDGRRQAERALDHLIETAQRRLEAGDLAEVRRIETLLTARRRIDRNVPPKLALAALFLDWEKR
jgi:DNA polymerase-3 subunit delta'